MKAKKRCKMQLDLNQAFYNIQTVVATKAELASCQRQYKQLIIANLDDKAPNSTIQRQNSAEECIMVRIA